MLFRFIGQYTNGHTTVDAGGVLFTGDEPSEVTDPVIIGRLTGHAEFEAVDDDKPRKRGRPKKAVDE